MDLGAPILDVESGSEKLVEDGIIVAPGFDPVVLTPTKTNKNTIRKRNFKPDVNIRNETETFYDE